MTVDPAAPQHENGPANSKLIRAAIWVAIGALIAAAIVCVVWVLVGTQNGIVGRAFLTILLLAAFSGAAILDARLAAGRPAWLALSSMVAWVLTLLAGAVLIWLPERTPWGGADRFFRFVLIGLILQAALLHVRLYLKAHLRHITTFTRTVAIVTLVLLAGLAVMLILPLLFNEYLRFSELYWRIVVAVTILLAVGTALVPLVNVLFAPRRPHAPATPHAAVPQAWPTYADGFTPLPALADGSPDWAAYYTGYPSSPQVAPAAQRWDAAPAAPAIAPVDPYSIAGGYGVPSVPAAAPTGAEPPVAPPVAPGYEGFPPAPPLPPRD